MNAALVQDLKFISKIKKVKGALFFHEKGRSKTIKTKNFMFDELYLDTDKQIIPGIRKKSFLSSEENFMLFQGKLKFIIKYRKLYELISQFSKKKQTSYIIS
ncbi:hypothetical protein BpHYR1_012301 [Brachionus plicatilis]|uniref:Uncharacterized protein n=1 Tax=Brachionus plicatilis TaxID=10195 RepID=A0A3M7R7M9_BRAPC|nr:hypothetical protein BpHYR1_012301 [Brachionus plicatilis]